MDLQEILKNLQENRKTIAAWSSTHQKHIKFYELTTGHQQIFVQNVMDSPFVNAPFVISLAKFIGETWNDEIPFNPDELTIQDKTSFTMALWIHSYSTDKTEKLKQTYQTPELPKADKKEISVNGIKIVLDFPSILKEATYSKFLKQWTEENMQGTEISMSNTTELNSIFYLLEPLIYVEKIFMNGAELAMRDYTTEDQITIGKNIPIPVMQEVSKTIKSYYTPILDKIKTVSIDETETVLTLNNIDFVITD
jgi:hypothetical protein